MCIFQNISLLNQDTFWAVAQKVAFLVSIKSNDNQKELFYYQIESCDFKCYYDTLLWKSW